MEKSCLDFDGTDDYVALSSSIDAGMESTLSLWVKLTSVRNRVILGEDSYSASYLIYYNPSGDLLYFRHGSVYVNWTDIDINDGEWHNLVFVRDNNNVKLYFDLVDKGALTNTFSVNTKMDTIGAKPDITYPFDGMIDEVKLYNYILNEEDMKEDYNMNKSLYFK